MKRNNSARKCQLRSMNQGIYIVSAADPRFSKRGGGLSPGTHDHTGWGPGYPLRTPVLHGQSPVGGHGDGAPGCSRVLVIQKIQDRRLERYELSSMPWNVHCPLLLYFLKVATRRNQKCFELMQNSYHCEGEALPIKYNNSSLKNMFVARSNQLSKMLVLRSRFSAFSGPL